MNKHIYPTICALSIVCTVTSATAQVAVRVNEDTGGCVVKHNRPHADTLAEQEAVQKWGWGGHYLLGSTQTGAGAVFGVTNPRSGKTRFFYEHGYGSESSAIKDARSRANRYASSLGVFAPSFICGSWTNKGSYQLDSYPTATYQSN